MGFLDRLFGASDERTAPPPPVPQARRLSEDELAIERYRYLLRTAPPESIEAVHAEAFAKLTPEQRAQVFRTLSEEAPAGERIVSDEPGALARAATRQELRSPGSMERAFSGMPAANGRPMQAGPSMGSMIGSSMLGTIAGVVIGSAIAQAFLPDPSSFDAGGDSGDAGADSGDAGSDASADASGDTGGDFGGDAGGDVGGGDFGGGDFGGGDFGGGGFGDFGGGDFGGF
ncbi:hypothetical protein EDM22_13560 [Agromyces tardus]|uniref:DUF2076 domain-containing protein n=1 Tax=Agromyces tardus TaxID=2583849 RepID=A0A3M8A678_9MICO|nr:hypothetical protein [Agromyces tardus]RNB46626.1 hypothetical protein EDM22_13560 [Agromyces tardus]